MNPIDKVYNFITEHNLIPPGAKVLAAVSGGVDSIVMLNLLLKVQPALDCRLALAHFNHNLRGDESQRDADFVRNTALNLNLPFFYAEWRSPPKSKKSIQTSARQARFAFLENTLKKHAFHRLALAHHQDDRLETVFFALIKGYGLISLRGITPQSGLRIHPLLCLTKNEILDYAHSNNLKWVEDSSNLKTGCLRNYIRRKIFPQLETIYPQFHNSLLNIAQEADILSINLDSLYNELLNKKIIILQKNRTILDINKFLPYFNMLKNFAFRKTLCRFIPDLNVSHRFLCQVNDLLFSAPGASILIAGINITKDRNTLIFTLNEPASPDEIAFDHSFQNQRFSLQAIPCAGELPQFNTDPNIEFIDSSCVKGKLRLRFWRKGDRFIPLGLDKEIKLSDFFINEKIPRCDKHHIPLLCDEEKIIWLCGIRLDNRVKITSASNNILKLIFNREF